MFPSHALCFIFHYLGLRSFPLTLSYCLHLVTQFSHLSPAPAHPLLSIYTLCLLSTLSHTAAACLVICRILQENWYKVTSPLAWWDCHHSLPPCYVRIRPDPDVPRRGQKIESSGQLSTVLTRTCAREMRVRQEETRDGRSWARGSERSEEPQTETREN